MNRYVSPEVTQPSGPCFPHLEKINMAGVGAEGGSRGS